MQVEGQHGLSLLSLMATGARVSNAYPTFRRPGSSLSKERLIPDGVRQFHDSLTKELSAADGEWIGVLRGRPPTLGLRHGPNSYGRQQ